MKSVSQIECVYEIIKSALPTQIAAELKFLRPGRLQKGGSDIMRGRILGKGGRKIWNSNWCFYEIGVGFYSASPSSVGGIGFVSFPENKNCGSGRHRHHISRALTSLVRRDGKFAKSDPPDPFQGAFSYYPSSRFRSFPTDHAAAGLAVLISTTFEDFNSLTI